MKKKTYLLFVNLFCLGSLTFAAQWEIPTTGISELQLRAQSAKLSLQKGTGPQIQVVINGAKAGLWKQESKDGVLKIVGPEENTTPNDSIVTLTLPVGNLKTTMVLEEVQAEVNGLSRLTLTALRGKINSKNTGEAVSYFMQRGDVQSAQHTGNLDIEVFAGKVSLSDGQAGTKVRLFSGDLAIDKNVGALTIEGQASNGKIAGQQGLVVLRWGRGALTFTEFSGRLEGQSAEGVLTIQAKAETAVDLQAERGKITVDVPEDSGSKLNLRSASGDLLVPSPLKPGREGRFRVVRGQLPGAAKGSINIRAEDATVVIR